MVSLNNYVTQNFKKVVDKESKEIEPKQVVKSYNFDDTLDYYMEREENFIVGIIDKNTNKLASTEPDLFKIRPPRAKVLDKKRGTGIPTFKGAVCSTSKDKGYLMRLVKMLPNISKEEIKRIDLLTREDICLEIRNNLMYLEKYATSKDGNKITYVMVPSNHPIYPFPYNLEDRIKDKIKKVNRIAGYNVDILTKKQRSTEDSLKIGDTDIKQKENIVYELSFKNDKQFNNNLSELNNIGFNLVKDIWVTKIE
jgi:hypothetical protein